ncbi:hypothetical protein GCM10028807_18070 [Spirosoma daeguense]
MKCATLFFLLLSGCAYAQAPYSIIRRDSLPSVFPPDVMPNARPNNAFYRHPSDPNNVLRATLDNMPIKVPDTSLTYSSLRDFSPHRRQQVLPFLKPMPRILPKRFK